MSLRRRAVVLSLALFAGLGLAACGDDDDGGGAASPVDPGDVDAFCARAAQYPAPGTHTDVEAARVWAELAELAPAEVRSDVAIVAVFFDRIAVSGDTNVEGPEGFDTASPRVFRYIEQTCGFSLGE
jgi:hypothetical protein